MALNEIISGMPLAAEKINENFKDIGKVTDVEKYVYTTKLPGGFKKAYGLTTEVASVPAGGTKTMIIQVPDIFDAGYHSFPSITLSSSEPNLPFVCERKLDGKEIHVKIKNNSNATAYCQAWWSVEGR